MVTIDKTLVMVTIDNTLLKLQNLGQLNYLANFLSHLYNYRFKLVKTV